ncbi:hypothetical protein [Moraxella canis]|nr:hypothetical protein [Moraxella canis]
MSLCDCVPTSQAHKLNLMGGRLLMMGLLGLDLVLGKWQAWAVVI